MIFRADLVCPGLRLLYAVNISFEWGVYEKEKRNLILCMDHSGSANGELFSCAYIASQ